MATKWDDDIYSPNLPLPAPSPVSPENQNDPPQVKAAQEQAQDEIRKTRVLFGLEEEPEESPDSNDQNSSTSTKDAANGEAPKSIPVDDSVYHCLQEIEELRMAEDEEEEEESDQYFSNDFSLTNKFGEKQSRKLI